MMRCFFSSLLTLVLFFNAALTWADSKTFQEIEEFLSHRNVLLSVEFSHASNMLSEDAKRSLDRIAKDIKALTKDSKVVRIEGFATPTGKEDYNLVLSMQRAMAVQDYLMERFGLDIDLYFNGYGSQAPSEAIVQLAFYDDTLGLAVADVDSVVTRQ